MEPTPDPLLLTTGPLHSREHKSNRQVSTELRPESLRQRWGLCLKDTCLAKPTASLPELSTLTWPRQNTQTPLFSSSECLCWPHDLCNTPK